MISSRNNLVGFLKKLTLILPFQFLRPFEKLSLFLFQRRDRATVPSAIFIIALPRSGSTLTYQCFSSRFVLNYLTNFTHFFFKVFLFSSLISFGFISTLGSVSTFRSSNGFVAGFLGQAEGLIFWRYWMKIKNL